MPVEIIYNMKAEKEINLTIPLDSGFTHILFNLAVQGYGAIEVEYSGSGDSGAIDSVKLWKREAVNIDKDSNEIMIKDYDSKNYGYPARDLAEVIEEKVYTHILNNAPDWYNNDGGSGDLYISTEDGQYYANHRVYYTESDESILEGRLGD